MIPVIYVQEVEDDLYVSILKWGVFGRRKLVEATYDKAAQQVLIEKLQDPSFVECLEGMWQETAKAHLQELKEEAERAKLKFELFQRNMEGSK